MKGNSALSWRAHAEHDPASYLEQVKKPEIFNVRKRILSFNFAGQGVWHLLAREPNIKIHMAFTLIAIGLGVGLHISLGDWRWIVFAIALVWSAEGMNTSLEALCDVVSPQYNEGIKTAKDVAAGAVLLASIGAAIIGLLTFIPYLLGPSESLLNLPICKSL